MSNQSIIKDIGGTIETFFATLRPATCTVSLYTDQGAAKVDAASATVDTVSTTASSATAVSATTVALASATGVVSGNRYIYGTLSSTAPQEVVTVRSVTASTATLAHPLIYAHNSGDAFRGGRVSYTVTVGAADGYWWDGYAVFTPDTGDPVTEWIDCTRRKVPDALIDKSDVLMIFPKGQKMLDSELDLPRALRQARDQFMLDMGGKFRALTIVGTADLKYVCALLFWIMRGPSMGPDWESSVKMWEAEYQKWKLKLQSQLPVDGDQDGTTSGEEDGGFTSGMIERS